MILMVVAMGCVGLPDSGRTGQAHHVSISDQNISPKDLTVQSGDEILFSNSGSTRVWVYFANDHWNALSCRRGFSYFWGNEESAAVQPNASVSLCFSTPESMDTGYSRVERTVAALHKASYRGKMQCQGPSS
jgi:plastocyanin